MSKFFAQILLSLVLGASAAAGSSPDVRGEVQGIVREATAFAHEVTLLVFETGVNVDAGSETSADASVEADVQAEAETGLNLDALVDGISDLLPNASVDGSVSAGSETDVAVESEDASLDLENTLETILDLGIGIGK